MERGGTMKKFLVLITIALIIFSPRLYWMFKPSTTLDIAVVDKTVPKEDYREHNGLYWILENNKIVRPNNELYDISKDYVGYDPIQQKENKSYNAKQTYDLIYIADTYGVYNDDLKEKPEGERTKKLYGGITTDEWQTIIKSKGKDTTLIAEFNSLATPTVEATRNIMERDLGIEWSKWIGRYFNDLNSYEVPQWLIRNYETQYKQKWNFDGPGLTFVHTSDKVVVLEMNHDDQSVTFHVTKQGQKQFDNVKSTNYMYWFDIVSPVEGSEVLAEYELNINSEGQNQLKNAGIPTEFPAIIHNEKNKSYYFAGDYADYPSTLFARWEKTQLLINKITGDKEFYWSTYVPLMNELLDIN